MDVSGFWIIIVVSIVGSVVVGCLVFFFWSLLRRSDRILDQAIAYTDRMWSRGRRPYPAGLSDAVQEHLSGRYELWATFGQFAVSVFVVLCITVLLLTRVISAEAGLPVLSGIGGFAIAKGVGIGRLVTRGRPEPTE